MGRLPDGLYQVTTASFCAGFVVEGGRVTLCAPILRRRLNYWMERAVRVGEEKKVKLEQVPDGKGGWQIRLGIFPDYHYIGRIDRNTYFKRIREDKHILRLPNAIGLNKELIEDEARFRFDYIMVDSGGIVYATSRAFFRAHAIAYHARGYEEQLIMPKDLWGRDKALQWGREEAKPPEKPEKSPKGSKKGKSDEKSGQIDLFRPAA